jgi:hypothetical protein
MCRAAVTLWLAEDNPAGARTDLARATWVPVTTGFHVQHFHAMLAEIELALYAGDRSRWTELRVDLERCEKSLLQRVVSIRAQTLYAHARLDLTDGDVRGAARTARALRKVASRTGHAWGALIAACVAREAPAFHEAAALCDRAGMAAFAAIARWRAGDEAARATLARLGVAAPDKLADAFAPTSAARAAGGSR